MNSHGLELLEKIHRDQTTRLVQLGLPQALALSEEDFLRKIPQPFPLSDSAHARDFDRLTLILPRNLADYETLFRLGEFTSFPKLEFFEDDFESPSEPYWIYWQYASIPDPGDPRKCRYGFPEAERGLIFQEGVHVTLQHPEILNSRPLDCSGTRYVRAHHTPCIYLHAGRVEVSAICRSAYCRHVIMGGEVARVLLR
jgi:hypothetical protein